MTIDNCYRHRVALVAFALVGQLQGSLQWASASPQGTSKASAIDETFDLNGPFDEADKEWPELEIPDHSLYEDAQVPTNDDCLTATAIPGSASSFRAVVTNIAAATATASEPQESCEFLQGGVSNSVWFSLRPRFCGSVSINTNGSDYDSVMSVFTGTCSVATQIACDDDGGTGVQSQLLEIPILARQLYRIKIADFGFLPRTADATLVLNLVANPTRGDLNADCEVDLDDYRGFFTNGCARGPGVTLQPGTLPDCTVFDFDHDGDFDLFDFSQLQTTFMGE